MGVNIYKYTWIFYSFVFFFLWGTHLEDTGIWSPVTVSDWVDILALQQGLWSSCDVRRHLKPSVPIPGFLGLVLNLLMVIFWAYFGLIGTRRHYILQYIKVFIAAFILLLILLEQWKSCLGSIADVIPRSYMGMIINHYKDIRIPIKQPGRALQRWWWFGCLCRGPFSSRKETWKTHVFFFSEKGGKTTYSWPKWRSSYKCYLGDYMKFWN